MIHWAALNWCGWHAILLILTLELTLALSNLAETGQLPGPCLPTCKIRAVLHPRLCKFHCVHSGKKQTIQTADPSVFCSRWGILLFSLKYQLSFQSHLWKVNKVSGLSSLLRTMSGMPTDFFVKLLKSFESGNSNLYLGTSIIRTFWIKAHKFIYYKENYDTE